MWMVLPAGCLASCFVGWQLPVGVVGVHEHHSDMCWQTLNVIVRPLCCGLQRCTRITGHEGKSLCAQVRPGWMPWSQP